MLQATTRGLSTDEIVRRLDAFAKRGYRFDVRGPFTLRVDRTELFDPSKRFGAGWTIWRGHKDGDGLKGPLDIDNASIAMEQIDFQDVSFESFMDGQAHPLDGEQRLLRIRDREVIALDAKVGEAAIDDPHQVMLRYLHDLYGITSFELAGTVLRRPDGKRFHAAVDRLPHGEWIMTCMFVSGGRHTHNIVPVVAL